MVNSFDYNEDNYYFISNEIGYKILRNGTIELNTGNERFVYLDVNHLKEMMDNADKEAQLETI